MFSEFGGTSSVRFFISRPVQDNIALPAAISAADDQSRLVLEIRVWSSTAPLIFPLLLSLVPLALYPDASNCMYFVYMVTTDFLVVLPLAIKGDELIRAGQREYFSTRTLIRGTPNVAEAHWSPVRGPLNA